MSLPTLKVEAKPELLATFREKLDEIGYEERAIAKLLGLFGLSQLDAQELPRYVWACHRSKGPLSTTVRLFLLGEGIPRKAFSDLFGRPLLNTLTRCGVLFGKEGKVYSKVVLYPCQGGYFFTDYWVTAGQEPGQVYELGTDSFVLARVTAREQRTSALDLCTGSGIHAVHSALAGVRTEAVDINPRALSYTQFNAALNGVEVATFEGDLYAPLEDKTYDLITANPPYVPSPDPEMLVHRSAGVTGEEIPERLVASLPKRLNPGGLFSMVLEYPVLVRETYLNRLQRWLGEKKGWGIAVLSFGEKSVGYYIKLHMGPQENQDEAYESYLQSYTQQGITSIDFATVFIQRVDPGQENWAVKRTATWPKRCRRERVARWLEDLRVYSDPRWRPPLDQKPNLSSYYSTVWRERTGRLGALEPTPSCWIPPERLNSEEMLLAWELKGEKTVAELLQDWREEGRSERSFWESLRSIGRQSAL